MPTFSIDELLPSLPVPNLEQTLEKYLSSVKPFVNEFEYKNTEEIVKKFQIGDGQVLQKLLLEKAKHERNWLEKYWLDYAYLEWRGPIAPFINTAGCLAGSTQKQFENVPENFKLNLQLTHASLNAYYYIRYFDEIRNERLPIHKSRSNYFSMDQWKRLFNTCRIPGVEKDILDTHFKTIKEDEKGLTHFLVIYRYKFYIIEAFHENKILNWTELYKSLEKIFENKSFGIGIGALIGNNRTEWAQNRQYLIDLDQNNKYCFDKIEKSIFCLVLDEAEPLNISELVKVGMTGNSKNRYFDKSVTTIITKNGKFTTNTDHTPFDGMVTGSLTQYFIDNVKTDGLNDITKVDSFKVRYNISEPQELVFVYDSHIKKEIEKSTDLYNSNSKQILAKDVKIPDCNKDLVKSFKVNPDTFAQMCIQLAYYQLHKKPGPTYETATTRSYYHGRTETLRSCTVELIEWCKEMCKHTPNRLNNEKLLDLFRKACKKHNKLMSEGRENSGVDRHLLGLMLLSRDLDMKKPEIFTDPSWKKSGGDGNFFISTSCLGYTNSIGTCAAMCTDGYTMIYAYPDDGLNFVLSRYLRSQETCLEKLASSLNDAVINTKALFKINSKI